LCERFSFRATNIERRLSLSLPGPHANFIRVQDGVALQWPRARPAVDGRVRLSPHHPPRCLGWWPAPSSSSPAPPDPAPHHVHRPGGDDQGDSRRDELVRGCEEKGCVREEEHTPHIWALVVVTSSPLCPLLLLLSRSPVPCSRSAQPRPRPSHPCPLRWLKWWGRGAGRGGRARTGCPLRRMRKARARRRPRALLSLRRRRRGLRTARTRRRPGPSGRGRLPLVGAAVRV